MAFSRAPVRSGTRLPRGGGFLPGTSRENICCMIEQSSPGKARDIRATCRRYDDGKGMWAGRRTAEFHSMRPHLCHKIFDVLHRAFGDSQITRPTTRMADFEVLGCAITGHAGCREEKFDEALGLAMGRDTQT